MDGDKYARRFQRTDSSMWRGILLNQKLCGLARSGIGRPRPTSAAGAGTQHVAFFSNAELPRVPSGTHGNIQFRSLCPRISDIQCIQPSTNFNCEFSLRQPISAGAKPGDLPQRKRLLCQSGLRTQVNSAAERRRCELSSLTLSSGMPVSGMSIVRHRY